MPLTRLRQRELDAKQDPEIMKRISQCRSRSSKGLRDRKCPEAEG